ncbi:MAG: class I SAM-dependent methyltransferase [bacterium]|nr:class I SAM-dependent methyltransferase [bacterium]
MNKTTKQTPTDQHISNYNDYDYDKEFWQAVDRRYEDACEKNMVRRMLARIHEPIHVVVDSGCGFGRLFPAYSNVGKRHILMDYSENMISQAKERLGNHESCEFIQGNLYDIPLEEGVADVFISVRTIHHLPDLHVYASEVHKTLSPTGHLIVEVPNKRHALNIAKWLVGRGAANPFHKDPLIFSETFVNFHPRMAIKVFKRAGFHVKHVDNTNFLRSSFIKRIIPLPLLMMFDRLLSRFLSWANLAPSVFLLLQKKP